MGQILLVRHGQASWGAADYDVLSETGWEQSRLLGAALSARGVAPAYVVRGSMRRHAETASGLGLGEAAVDPGWDEFGMSVFAAHPTSWAEGEAPSRAKFQAWFEEATDRWTGGAHDDYEESFAAFGERVEAALRRTAKSAGSGTALVVSSGGPVAWIAAALLGRDLDLPARTALWRRLNPVCVNTGVTKLVAGRRGLTFVTFNDHTHLPADLVTYR